MRTVFRSLLTFVLLVMFTSVMAQVPAKFNYQGIARDPKGVPFANKQMALKISVLPAADAQMPEYEETQLVQTNEFGLYTLQIGGGTATNGKLENVKWESGNKYIQVAIDPDGGNNFIEIGRSQLLSVPYAMYAGKAGVARETTDGHAGATRTGTVSSAAGHVAGDANYVTKFTGLNTIAKSQILDNGTVVGVGSAPFNNLWALHVKKPGATYLTVQTDAGNSTAAIRLQDNTGSGGELGISKFGNATTGTFMGVNRKGMGVINNLTGPFLFNVGGYCLFGQTVGANQLVRLMIDSATGFTGINTTIANPPTQNLDINGNIRIRGGSPAAGKLLISNATGVGSWSTPSAAGLISGSGSLNYIPRFNAGGNSLSSSDLQDIPNTGLLYNALAMPDLKTGFYFTQPDLRSAATIHVPGVAVNPNYFNLTSSSINHWMGLHFADSAKYAQWYNAGGPSDSIGSLYFNKGINRFYLGDATIGNGFQLQVDNGKMGNQITDARFTIASNSDTAAYFSSTGSNLITNGILRSQYTGNTLSDHRAIVGHSRPAPFFGVGVQGIGGYCGVWGVCDTGTAGVVGESYSGNAFYGISTTQNGLVAISSGGPFVGAVVANASLNDAKGVHAVADSNHAGLFTAGDDYYSPAMEAGVLRGQYTGNAVFDAVGVYGFSKPDANSNYGLGVKGEGGYQGVYGIANANNGTKYGVYGYATGTGTNYAGYFSGIMYATTVTGGTKPFTIDHPLDPENKFLRHSSIESPDMMNMYNGNIVTDTNGYATITLPDYFEALNEDFKYQLTVIDNSNDFIMAKVTKEISNNTFEIRSSKPNAKVSWLVSGVRHDAVATRYKIIVEEEKPADMKGKYLEPEAYGKPVSMGANNPESKAGYRPQPDADQYKQDHNRLVEEGKALNAEHKKRAAAAGANSSKKGSDMVSPQTSEGIRTTH